MEMESGKREMQRGIDRKSERGRATQRLFHGKPLQGRLIEVELCVCVVAIGMGVPVGENWWLRSVCACACVRGGINNRGAVMSPHQLLCLPCCLSGGEDPHLISQQQETAELLCPHQSMTRLRHL